MKAKARESSSQLEMYRSQGTGTTAMRDLLDEQKKRVLALEATIEELRESSAVGTQREDLLRKKMDAAQEKNNALREELSRRVDELNRNRQKSAKMSEEMADFEAEVMRLKKAGAQLTDRVADLQGSVRLLIIIMCFLILCSSVASYTCELMFFSHSFCLPVITTTTLSQTHSQCQKKNNNNDKNRFVSLYACDP